MVDIHHNLTDLKKFIQDALKKVDQLKLDRADTNDEINSIRAALAAKGIKKKAFDMAAAYLKMDPDDRENFDVAYALVREAGGLPLQDDLFSAAERMGSTKIDEPGDKPKEPDAAKIDKVIKSQDAAKVVGKKVHEPTGEHKGAIN